MDNQHDMTKDEERTELLQGSMITVIDQQDEGRVGLGFNDGTWIEAQIEPGTVIDSNALSGGVVEVVRQGRGELSLKLEDGESVEINTARTPGSVIVTDHPSVS